MRKSAFTLAMLLTFNLLYAQITLTTIDFPSVKSSYWSALSKNYSGIDLKQTGTNYNWDFRSLACYSQKKDSFLSTTAVPVAYQLLFNSYLDPKPNMALAEPNFSLLDSAFSHGIYKVGDIYNYYKKTDSSYSHVGFAMTINDLPVGIVYQSPDIEYVFPLQYGHKDSSVSVFETPPVMSDIFYYHSIQKRVNHTDGWGTLKTPYGTFNVLRIKSVISKVDSLKINDSLQAVGQPVITEYKWLGANSGLPLLEIRTKTSGTNEIITSVSYLDSFRNYTSIRGQLNPNQLNIFPNPFRHQFHIDFYQAKSAVVKMELFNLYGQKILDIMDSYQAAGKISADVVIPDQYSRADIYFVKISSGTEFAVKRLLQLTD